MRADAIIHKYHEAVELVKKLRSTKLQGSYANDGSCVLIGLMLVGFVEPDNLEIEDFIKVKQEYARWSNNKWEGFKSKYENWESYILQLIEYNPAFSIQKEFISYPTGREYLSGLLQRPDTVINLSVLQDLPCEGLRPKTHRVSIKSIDLDRNMVALVSDFDPRLRCILSVKNDYFAKASNIEQTLDKYKLVVEASLDDIFEVADITAEAINQYNLRTGNDGMQQQFSPLNVMVKN